MHKLWLYSVRGYLKLGMFFYFKKIQVFNVENVPKDKAVLILSNHQNALLDALLIATQCGRFVFYLTRASVFKKSFVDKLLRSLQMLPVYRIRDGWSNITKNNSIFTTCSELLNKGEGVVIFPEGSHSLKRTVRPFSKGFTRIVFETLQNNPDTDLKLLPVGLNFVKPKEFGDSVSIYFGNTLEAKQYALNFDNDNVIKLKQDVHTEISKLTTHIPSDEYHETLESLDKLNVDYLDPKSVNTSITSNLKEGESTSKPRINGLRAVLRFMLKLVLFGPYLIWSKLLKPKITEEEFTSTFRFAVALTLVPLWLIVIGVVLSLFFGWMIGIGFIVSVLLFELLAVKI